MKNVQAQFAAVKLIESCSRTKITHNVAKIGKQVEMTRDRNVSNHPGKGPGPVFFGPAVADYVA